MRTLTRLMRVLSLLVVVAILVPRFASAQVANYDNGVIVLDASGSMNEDINGVRKIDAAKSALKEVLKQLSPNVYVGLVVFSAKGVKDDWIYPLGPRDDGKLTAAIDLPQPQGNTPLSKYIKIGADRLLQERKKQFGYGTYRLLLLTDGEETEGNREYEKYTPDIMSRGITFDVIGVGMNGRHTLATKVNSYRAANDPASLKKAIAEVMAEVGKTGNADVDNEAYQMIATLPNGFAEAVIKALSNSGNEPIGERPKVSSSGGTAGPSIANSPKPFFWIIGIIFAIVVVIKMSCDD